MRLLLVYNRFLHNQVFLDPHSNKYSRWERLKNSTLYFIRAQQGIIPIASPRAITYDIENPKHIDHFSNEYDDVLDDIVYIAKEAKVARTLLTPDSCTNMHIFATPDTLVLKFRDQETHQMTGEQGVLLYNYKKYDPENPIINKGFQHFYMCESRAGAAVVHCLIKDANDKGEKAIGIEVRGFLVK